MAAHSHYGLHTHACHIMNPSGGFGHGECRRGGARPRELWVFPPMDVSWILTPTRITGWSHKTMEWAQLPLASHSTLLRLEKTIINTDAGGHPGSLACFPGVGLLFSAVLQLSWGPSKPCPGQPSYSLGFFNSPRVQLSEYSLPRSSFWYCWGNGEQASRPEDPGHGLSPKGSGWEHSLATEDSIPQLSIQDQGRDFLSPRWGLLGTRIEQTKYYPNVHRLRSKILPDQRLQGLT